MNKLGKLTVKMGNNGKYIIYKPEETDATQEKFMKLFGNEPQAIEFIFSLLPSKVMDDIKDAVYVARRDIKIDIPVILQQFALEGYFTIPIQSNKAVQTFYEALLEAKEYRQYGLTPVFSLSVADELKLTPVRFIGFELFQKVDRTVGYEIPQNKDVSEKKQPDVKTKTTKFTDDNISGQEIVDMVNMMIKGLQKHKYYSTQELLNDECLTATSTHTYSQLLEMNTAKTADKEVVKQKFGEFYEHLRKRWIASIRKGNIATPKKYIDELLLGNDGKPKDKETKVFIKWANDNNLTDEERDYYWDASQEISDNCHYHLFLSLRQELANSEGRE